MNALFMDLSKPQQLGSNKQVLWTGCWYPIVMLKYSHHTHDLLLSL